MDQKYESLFTPWKIGNCEIKNRIVMTSMGGTSIFGWMEPNHFDKEAANFLLERAKGGAGLILPGIAPVQNPVLGEWLYQNKGMYRKLKVFMDEIHKTGAKMFVQITAGFGRSMAVTSAMEMVYTHKVLNVLAKPFLNVSKICATSSASPNRWSDKVPSRPLTIKEIHKFIDAFAKTAKLCKQAGVDGVEIHAVHEGYMLDQFTLKYVNKRTDEYGGSFENRYRFPCEIVEAIKKVCGKDYPVSLRYSVISKTKGFRSGAMPGEDYTEVGRDMEESRKAAVLFQKAGYDMLNCDNGTYDAWYWAHPPIYMPEDCNLKDVEEIKKVVSIPVVCAGRMDPTTASVAIKEGKIDAMGVARQFLADPNWVNELKNGHEEEIRPCICCHNGCFTMCHYKGVANDQPMDDVIHMARCAINAETMQSKIHYIEETKHPKTVAIIGGGVGGMETARVLALRGHHPVIYEKSDHLGGVFMVAGKASFKGKLRDLLTWYLLQMKELKVEIHLNTKVDSLDKIAADEYVIATGSKPRTLRVPGIEKAIEACDYLSGKKPVGENIIVVGGGLTGCEIAYELALENKKVTIVEMTDDLVKQKGVCMANSTYLRDYFAYHKTPVYLESKLKEVTDTGAIITRKDGKDLALKADNVITATGYIPTPLTSETRNIHQVGDCVHIGNLRHVIWRAYDVAMAI